MHNAPNAHPSMQHAALDHVLQAARDTTLDRLQLYVLELKIASNRALASVVLALAGTAFVALGWMLWMGAAVIYLTPYLGLWPSLAWLGLSQVLLGSAFLVAGKHDSRSRRAQT